VSGASSGDRGEPVSPGVDGGPGRGRPPESASEPPPLAVEGGVAAVTARLAWLEAESIWPNGLRYLWTDGFGVVLLVSLADATGDPVWLDRAEAVVGDVDRVLGRAAGHRIGEAPDRYGQYFHYLTLWAFALGALGAHRPGHRRRAVSLIREVHPRFLVPGRGIWWKMAENLSGPEPGFGFGALDPFQARAVYRSLDGGSGELGRELADLAALISVGWRRLHITQDLGLGMMLWSSRWCEDEGWAPVHRDRALAQLDRMWIDPPGYFCRQPGSPSVHFAFTNAGVALGLQAVAAQPDRVAKLLGYFDHHRSRDHYDRDAITHVMACVARFPGAMLPADTPPAG